MLQQILRDMWVEPEILAELDEAQKQTLFCKMREEQVRRWRLWDQKLTKKEEKEVEQSKLDTLPEKKTVQFLQGEDGEPWVWVMGEHKDDQSIESILLEEAREKAQRLALKEAEQLRKSVERELTQLIDYKPLDSLEQQFDISPKQTDFEDAMEIYCTVDDLRERIQAMQPDIKIPTDRINNSDILKISDSTEYKNEKNLELDINKNLHFNFIEGKRDVLQEIGITGGGGGAGGVSNRVAAWERRVAAARAGEILRGLRQRRARQARDAEQLAQDQDVTWREQERKAKQAEQQMREIARAAREEHRRSSVNQPQPPAPDTEHSYSDTTFLSLAGKPPSRDAIVEWFRSKELRRGAGLDEDHKPAEWFHGLITRSEAESILVPCAPGSFLLRISERIWGYAISYRATERCKHYLVDATNPQHYRFLGDNQITHTTLAELVNYHKTNAITESGGELLLQASPVPSTPAILQHAHA